MSDNVTLKCWLWERTDDKSVDNIKHNTMNDSVNMVSIPIEDNDLTISEDGKCPEILNTLKSRLEFKGNIRLSNSGHSWNLFKDVLDTQSDLVSLSIKSPF